MLKGVSAISRAVLNDDILLAIANMVDDAQVIRREPSHSDISFQIERAGLLQLTLFTKGGLWARQSD